ncbi:MAG: response regulator [Candidatus Eisenbacteria bacterium]|nr:response regulator [Candidatus Eisenbacteria bacterium]
MKPRILIIDDDREFSEDLALLLENDFDVRVQTDPQACRRDLEERDPALVLLDLDLGPSVSGFDLLPEIVSFDADLPVIVLTKSNQPRDAVQAMRRGAYNFIVKEPNVDELRCLMHRAVDDLRRRRELRRAREELDQQQQPLIGESPAIRQILQAAERVARTDATVLITGESGTGKEMIARRIQGQSPRRERPFVAVNCAAFTESLLESELFGHEAGAFTGALKRHRGRFEQAAGGTLFLDEVGTLPPSIQPKILRVVQERSFHRLGGEHVVECDVRILAATNLDLEKEVAAGRFRSDLFYRLNVYRIHVPSLRERKDDIARLVQHFLHTFALEMNRRTPSLTDAALAELVQHPWPGNVRELASALQRAMIDTDGDLLDVHHFSYCLPEESTDLPYDEARKRVLESFRKRYLARAMRKAGGNVSQAARAADLPRSSLQRMLREAGLSSADFRPTE